MKTNEIKWEKNNGKFEIKVLEGTEKILKADLVFLALGFIGPEKMLLDQMGVTLDDKFNISADHGSFQTNKEGVFTAGYCRRGQSLVVWAMNEGRGAALSIDRYLQGSSKLSAPMLKLGSEES